MKIALPYHYDPRPYQVPFWEAAQSKRRGILVWHRRTGKDKTLWNFTIAKAMERVGTYYYFFPSYAQGKKVLWNGRDKEGFAFRDHIPQNLRLKPDNETEMQVFLTNGSIIQVVGTDNIDSIVGTNPVGCVYSEYAIQDPRAWEFTRPILRENDGWAWFLFTPRGKNFAYKMLKHNERNPAWFTQILTVEDTGMKGLMDAEVADGMDPELAAQEYMCSFTGSTTGTYYARQIEQAEKDGRITDVPYNPAIPVETWWDIGLKDATAIWFVQPEWGSGKLRVIDYTEASGESLNYWVSECKNRGYIYDQHIMPHDIKVREFTDGVARIEAAENLGLRPITVAPKLSVQEGVEAVRRMFSRCWFDQNRCKRGLDALTNYRKKPLGRHGEEDDQGTTYTGTPVHDWTSHGADAFRTGAVGRDEGAPDTEGPKVEGLDFDVFGE